MSLAEFTFTSRLRPIIELGLGRAPVNLGTAGWDAALWDNSPDTWVGSDHPPTQIDGRWQVAYWGDAIPGDGLPSPADPGFVDAGDAHWSGFEPEFYDVTCDAISVEMAVGRARITDRFEVGFASIVLANLDGKYDMHLPAAPPGAVLSLVPGRAIRVGVNHDLFGDLWLWRGYIDDVVPGYDPVAADVLTINAIDAVGEVGRFDVPALADPGVGSGEGASARIRRILTAARWWLPDGADISPAATAMLPTTLGAPASDLLNVTAESEGGSLFGDNRGRVAFRQRDWQVFTATDPVDAHVGNVNPTDVCPTDVELAFRRGDIVTRVVIGRTTDTTPKVYEDRDGIALYGHETWESTDLICSDVAVLPVLANRILRTRSHETQPRVEAVGFDAATSTEAADLMCFADPRKPSRWQMLLDVGNGAVLDDREMFVTGMRHSMTPERWTARYDLDLAWPYAVAAPFVWSSPAPPYNDVLAEPFNNLSAWAGTATIVPGRTGTAASVASFGQITYTIPAAFESDTVVVGFAFQVSGLGSENRFMELRADAAATEHAALAVNSAGQLIYYRGTSGLVTTAAGAIAANTWVYLEARVKLHDTAGEFEVRLNGSPVIGPLTNQDTRNGGTKTAFDSWRLCPRWFTGLYDDAYLSTGANAPFKGPISVPTAAALAAVGDPGHWNRKSGTGPHAQWTNEP